MAGQGRWVGLGLVASLLIAHFPPSKGQAEECCPYKTVENSIIEKFNGFYTLLNDSQKREETCNDGCIYEREGFEYCFVTKPGELLIRPLAYLVCEVGKTTSEGVQMLNTITTAEKH